MKQRIQQKFYGKVQLNNDFVAGIVNIRVRFIQISKMNRTMSCSCTIAYNR